MVKKRKINNHLSELNFIMNLSGYIDSKEAQLLYLTGRFKEIETAFQIVTDNGSVEMIKGFRIQHNVGSMPMFGGLRIHQSFSVEDGKNSALKNTMKASMLDLAFAGSSGAINLNISQYSHYDIDRIIDSYIGSIMKNIGPNYDIFGTDVNVDVDILKKIHNAYSNRSSSKNACGDSMIISDISQNTGQENQIKDANGISISLSVGEWCRRRNIEIDSMTAVIQGFGNTGYAAGKILRKMGSVIVGIQSNAGSFYNPYGIDLDDFFKKLNEGKLDKNYEGAKKINLETFFTIKSDIFISSASENQIGKEEASMLNVKCVIEGIDNAVSDDGEDILKKRNIYLIPDIIASSGSLFYGTANRCADKKNIQSREKLEKSLSEKICRALDSTERVAHEKNLQIKESAIVCASQNLIKKFG